MEIPIIETQRRSVKRLEYAYASHNTIVLKEPSRKLYCDKRKACRILNVSLHTLNRYRANGWIRSVLWDAREYNKTKLFFSYRELKKFIKFREKHLAVSEKNRLIKQKLQKKQEDEKKQINQERILAINPTGRWRKTNIDSYKYPLAIKKDLYHAKKCPKCRRLRRDINNEFICIRCD